MPDTLFLRLEGPLQSWGERGRWSVRDSALTPTKSGVIGLIACALGYREDDQIRPLSRKTRMGARVDAPGRLITDYHTIGGGYERPALLTAQGKPKKTPKGQPHTEISHREYLCDASFLVALQVRDAADAPLIEQMAAALQNPVWPLYLGRKSCPPAAPVFAGTGSYPDLETALTGYAGFTHYRKSRRPIICQLELEADQPSGARRRDNIHSRRYRVFHPRYTTTPDRQPRFTIQEVDDHVSLQIVAE
jgi:CRISPR system Cascade subunit CasD